MAQAYYELFAKDHFAASDFDDDMLIMAPQNQFAASKNDLKDELSSNAQQIWVPGLRASAIRVTAHQGKIRNIELSKRNSEIRFKEMKKKRKKASLVQLIDRSNSFSLKMKELEKKELAKKKIETKDEISTN